MADAGWWYLGQVSRDWNVPTGGGMMVVSDGGLEGRDGCYQRRASTRWYPRGMEGNYWR